MRTIIASAVVAAVAVSALAACSSSSSSTVNGQSQYQQIERLSRPAIKEVFESFTNHDATNRSAPTNDSQLQSSIQTFLGGPPNGVANRSAATATFIIGVLIPDETQADLSVTVGGCGTPNTPCAAYLGHETGGATGTTFGGRWLNDDVVKTSLGIIFGNTVSALGGAPNDNMESWCLSDQNLSAGEGAFQTYSATFPYVNAPY
jgi:hypothetical protein